MCGHLEEAFLEPFNKVNQAIFEIVTPSLDVFWLKDTNSPKGKQEHMIVVRADLAGFKKNEIDVTLDGNILTIEAERESLEDSIPKNQKDEFRKIFNDRPEKVKKRTILPFDPNHGGKNASLRKPDYKDGVLEIQIGNIQGIQENKP